MDRTVLLSLNNVSVAYQQRHRFFKSRNFWALKDISFDVYRGESLGIIGRNGAGKSTLLKLLAGLISPDEGFFLNFNATVSLLAIQAGFIPYLNAHDNAILSLMFLGLTRKQALERLPKVLDFAELGEFEKEPIKNYSSGMVARLGFAVAFQANPDVLLVDEAGAVGDAHFRKKSQQYISEQFTETNTLVLVSHSPQVIATQTDRVVWLEHGKIVQVGATQQVLEKYESSE